MSNMVKKCKKCDGELFLINKVRELADIDFDNMSDGQMADWFGEEASGEYTNHGVDMLTYKCQDCKEFEYVIE